LYLTEFSCQANILIDRTGHARLADFGLLTIIKDPANLLTSTTYTQGGSVRWMSPELIDPQQLGLKHSHPTESSDCYALGMVIYETISGNPPFHEDADLTVVMKVMQGKRPPRGVKFRKDLWRILEQCWESQPSSRPSIGEVLRCLETYKNSS
jgi:serine/threonine protein kinase